MSEMAQRIVDTLNNMWRLDNRVTRFMKNCRFETTDAMLAHPTMPFMFLDGKPIAAVGLMSVLNSLLDRNKERVICDYRDEDKERTIYFRVITPEENPELFVQSLTVQDADHANDIAACMLPIHSQRDMVVVRKYDRDKEGALKARFAIEPEEAVAQKMRDALKDNPDSIAIGTSIKQAGQEPIDHVTLIPTEPENGKGDERET